MSLHKYALVLFLSLWAALGLQGKIGVEHQMQLGNPSTATDDPSNHVNYLIQRAQYAMDYNAGNGQPNWVSWDLTSEDIGGSGRSDFQQDTTLPAGFYQVLTSDYSGSGYDRGHMCPSADRTVTVADNKVVFYMSNMIPQTPDNNQGVWANFENYCRSVANEGNELLILCGPGGFGGSRLPSNAAAIPGYTWKIVVVVPVGAGMAIDRIDSNTRVIAIKIPNIAGVRSDPWQNYLTTVDQLEADTGFDFFTALPLPLAALLESKLDGQPVTGIPVITSPPVTQTTVVGGTASFSVTATGDAPLLFQWFKDDAIIDGATSSVLTLTNVSASDMGSYDVVVSNAVGSTTSTSAKLVLLGLPPVVTSSPVSQTVNDGSNVTFAVSVSGSPTITYQWRKDGSALAGATSSTLTLLNVQADHIGLYDVVISNSVGTTLSNAATLDVQPVAPSITGQPANQTPGTGGSASFTVVAIGTEPLTYQWFKDGNALANTGIVSGADSATLRLVGVSAADVGSYAVVVTNALGSATSNAASLAITAPPPSTVNWNFGTSTAPSASPSSGLTDDISGGLLTQGNNNGTTALLTTTSASGSYAGASGANNAGAAARIGALNTAAGGSAYFEWTLAPSAGKRLSVTGLSFGMRSTSTGPQAYTVYTSVDNFTTPVAGGTITANGSWSLHTPAFTNLLGDTGTAITFRLYGHSGSGSASANTANWRMDDLKVTVTGVYPPPVAPVVSSVSPANGANSVSVSTPITVTFNEAVSFTGPWFTISSAKNGTIAAAVSGGPTSFTLTPPVHFDHTDIITVSVNSAQVVDQASGTIHGTGITSWSFDTADYVPPSPPSITTQPLSQTVNAESSVSFSVIAEGTAPFSYQWRKDGAPVTGNNSAASATLTLTNVSPSDNGSYTCLVSNLAGSDLSQAASLVVNLVPPTVTSQPQGRMSELGGTVSLSVTASGTGPLSYQWRKDGQPLIESATISGVNLPVLALAGLVATDTGSYDVVITNVAGMTTSQAATVLVTDAVPEAIYWDFTTASPTRGLPAEVTGGSVTQGNNNGTTVLLTTTSASSGYAGVSGTFNAGAAARIGALNTGAGGSAYFEFTLTAPADKQLAVSAIAFGSRSTGTGPQAFALFSSADNFTAPLSSGILANNSSWRLLSASLPGVTSSAGESLTFRLYGYNGTGSPSANTANWRIDDLTLTVGLLAIPPVPPAITEQPQAQTVNVFADAYFTVGATGTGPLSYQWRKDGASISDNASASTATLMLGNVSIADAGIYDCVITNIAGSALSEAAVLTVNKVPASVSLANLSQRYDGTPRLVTASTTPEGLTLVITYDGLLTAPTLPGTYEVVATVEDADYTGSASGILHISTTALVRHLNSLNGDVDGSVQVTSAESITLNSNAGIYGDLLVAGTPNLRIQGNVTLGGTIDASGSATPANATVTLNGNALLGHLVRRVDAATLPVVAAPLAPAGTRSVSINQQGQTAGDFATLRDLTLNSNAGSIALPAGAYGSLTVNGASSVILGVEGSTEPAVYHLQRLTLNGTSRLRLAGPVIIVLANGVSVNGLSVGEATHPEWLTLKVSSGGLTLNSNATLSGTVVAPTGTVTLNGNSILTGRVIADSLVVNGNALLKEPELVE